MAFRLDWQKTVSQVMLSECFKSRKELHDELKEFYELDNNTDYTSVISRFLNGETETAGFFAGVDRVFWDRLVNKAYPFQFVDWWMQVIDACGQTDTRTRENFPLRSLIGEVKRCWQAPSPALTDVYPRYEAAYEFACGLADALRVKCLGQNSPEVINRGVAHLKKAVMLFRQPMIGEIENVASDRFHMAQATLMADYLLSEISPEVRKIELQALFDAGGVRAVSWLADITARWDHYYNLAEMFGTLGQAQAAEIALRKAIIKNPRLADFDAVTDDVVEALSTVPALQDAIAALKKLPGFLEPRLAAYRNATKQYQDNPRAAIRAMIDEVDASLKKPTTPVTTSKRSARRAGYVTAALTGLGLLFSSPTSYKPTETMEAKPRFPISQQQYAAKPVWPLTQEA